MSKKQKVKSRSNLSKVIVIVIAIVLCSLAVIVFTKRPENQRVLGASTHQTTFFEGFVSFFERLFGKQQQNPTQQDDSSLFGFMHSGNTETVVGEASGGVDIHAIPLGDGHISSSPKVGYVFSCETNFNGNGAEHAGDWIQGDTWDLTKKIAVQGSVSWDLAYFKSVLNGISRNLSGNGLPVGSTTGIFPIQRSDPASEYDRNPNSIKTQSVNYDIPANPEFAASPSCVPMGAIGYALNGVAIYNAVDDAGRDAVAHEVQDTCDGHPQGQGEYHYHGPSECIEGANEKNTLIGYALDGFGIFSMYDENGNKYSNADLDECHGITSEIEWNGQRVAMYHYVLTQEYPYTVGCFRGTSARTTGMNPAGGPQVQKQEGSTQQVPAETPPQPAIDACNGESVGSSCSFSTPRGKISGTCSRTPSGTVACRPS